MTLPAAGTALVLVARLIINIVSWMIRSGWSRDGEGAEMKIMGGV